MTESSKSDGKLPKVRVYMLLGVLAVALVATALIIYRGYKLERSPVTIPGLELTLFPIEPGSFRMGSDKLTKDEKPAHTVILTERFWMAKTEVTRKQFEAVMGPQSIEPQADGTPVIQVSWQKADKFCKKLTERERKAGRLRPDEVFRLPTEAEWEYCCRAGSTGIYCFGDDAGKLPEFAWIPSNADDRIHPVAQKKPNAWGLYDMHGNVAEWCWAYLGDYEEGTKTDPVLPAQKYHHSVLRGGSYYEDTCASAKRKSDILNYSCEYIGFRIVRAKPVDSDE